VTEAEEVTMRILSLILLWAALASATEVEIELSTGSRFTPVEVESKGLTHMERDHTGDTVAEQGAEPKGYRIRIIAGGQVVHEESK
jgi:hypothetical protein